mmetsp:Transcript_14141/g.33411  ORF Transcript_14141/g.33411 Transcript_14141/m.33411 type:complete len:271 (+) Transcript_14141:561-1373(+)
MHTDSSDQLAPAVAVAGGSAALAEYCAHLEAASAGPNIQADDQSWPGLHDRGVVMLASGHTLRAKELFEAAKAAIPPRQQEHAVLSPMTMKQAAADVSMGLGQTYMIEKKWDNAEEHLSEAVTVAEGAAGSTHPLVAAPLVLLAECYVKTQRFLLAEGLYRKALQLLGLGGPSSKKWPEEAFHPTMAAFACWRYSQLLAVMPQRTTETGEWSERAHALWSQACTFPLEVALGRQDALKGTSSKGSGAAIHLQARRLVICYPVSPSVSAAS